MSKAEAVLDRTGEVGGGADEGVAAIEEDGGRGGAGGVGKEA